MPAAPIPTFVGRERELSAMHAALAQAEASQGRLLLVTGEPGIGKSALVDAFASHADRRGANVLWGAAWEDSGVPAYWPWVQILRGIAREPAQSDHSTHDLTPLGKLLPDLARPGADTSGAEGERFALFDAVVGALELASRAAPLVVVIEDLHAAGLPSALLLQFVAQHTRAVPVLLVVTYRDVEARLTAGLGEIIAALEAAGVVLPLPGMSPQEVHDLVAPLLADAPDGLLTAIIERTKGNPLFVAQVARLLAHSPPGSRDLRTAPIPAGIKQAVRQRLERLATAVPDGDATRRDDALAHEALTVGAVLGGDMDLGEVAPVLDTPVMELLEALGPAVHSGLLVELAPQRYRFAHALVRETIYQDLPLAVRARRHHRIGTLLAKRLPAEGSHARVAHHLLAAVAVGGAEAAVRHATAAGQEAMAALAYEEAAGLFRQALSALHHTTGDRTEQRSELLLSLGTALVVAGDLGRAQPVLVQATEHARRCANGELLGRAALLRTKHLEYHTVDHEAIALLEEAIRALDGRDTPTLAHLYAQLGLALQYGEPEQMVAAADRAVEVARRSGDNAALFIAMSMRLHTRWGRHEPRAALAEAEELVRLADQSGDAELAATAHQWRYTFSLELGEPTGAQAALDALTEVAERSQQPLLRLVVASRASTLAALAGRFDEALTLADEVLQIGLRAQLPDAAGLHSAQLFAIWHSVGLAAEHEARMERTLRDIVARSAERTAYEARLLLVELSRGARPDLAARFESLVQNMPELRHDLMYVWTLALLAEACTELGTARHADTLYAALLPYADRFAVASGVICMGAVNQYLGELAALAGRLDDAEQHFQAAIAQHRRAGAEPMLARSRRAYERLLQQPRAPGDERRPERAAAGKPPAQGLFRRSGRTWQVQWNGTSVTVPDSKGMRDLAVLLAAPEREVPVLDLVEATGGPAAAAAGTHAGERLDGTARRAYRQRLADLEDELAEAEVNADVGRLEALRREQQFLAAELAGALGLGGRVRTQGDPVERARKAVGMRIRTALRAIAEVNPTLARHLDRSVATGRFCAYRPEHPVRWRL